MPDEPNISGAQLPKLDAVRHRDNWLELAKGQRAFYLERAPLFSPAAAAQDAANFSRMLWCWSAIWIPWEYTNWLEEGRSFHDAAFIGDWTGLGKIRIKGPDAFAFFHQLGTNDLSKFAVGRMKHHVQVDEHGKVAAQGVLYRLSDDDFMMTGGTSARAYYMLERGTWKADAAVETPDHFLFAIQGPRSLEITERVVDASLTHLQFNQFGEFSVDGTPVRVLRTGVTGELGYELHGPAEYGNTVWLRAVEAGREFGIKQLGVRSQMISHVEAGIPNNEYDFCSAPTDSTGVAQRLPIGTGASKPPIGSYRPADRSELYRSPFELGWYKQVSLESHDFIGRDALRREHEAGGPDRRLVGLIWNDKDVIDVFATFFQEDIVLPMEMPRYIGLELNHVLSCGKIIGCATSRTYSPFLHKMISLGHIDTDLAKPGTKVTVLWGQPDGPQREIRAVVISLPFKKDVRRS
jgi:glycine cleavage system aminomethyltransferase T